ncbi:TetR/AcrR family transcriptional regulator [Umezawaea endophytica]|uniref:TetR/AcrR family transcriptional regulator n=1 Tax=Umezawaea endophytica TaxID=1654476 RepID=A0A9X2VNL2_9PSEU|nr:TetR/AcrR family transcriptional regulator [Umezawaea endophytica]MCS7479302.1 TetR/AcrR family transcriptional regulator [Umezawaea endophytica]
MECTPTFLRARRPEQKQQRYDAIRAAARELALERGVRSVSLGDIATAVGVHKSAILRYFETREEIYLSLGAEAWSDWSDAVHAELDGVVDGSPLLLADVLSRTLGERPLLCDLLTQAPLNLERHVSKGAVRSFKVSVLDGVEELAALIGRVVPGIGPERGFEAVAAIACQAASIWQVSHPSSALADLYSEEPELARACPEFVPTIHRFTLVYVTGLLATAD